MRIDVIREANEFQALEGDWDEAVASIYGQVDPFLSHFWFSAYYRSFLADHDLFVVTAREEAGRLLAMFPGVIGRRRLGGIPLKEVRLIAGAHSHINAIPTPPERDDIVEHLIDRVLDEGIDVLYLEDPAKPFPERRWYETFCRSRSLPLEVVQVRTSPYIPTTGSFDDYRQGLSKRFRGLLNNRINRINRAGGYDIKTYSQHDDVETALSDIGEISAKSWQGRQGSGVFATVENERFYRDLIDHAMRTGYGRVSILYFEDHPAAFEFHVVDGTTEYCLKAEYSQTYEQVSPGAVLDLELVKRAFGSQIETYDLLGYADRYKLRWTKHTRPYYRYFIFNRSAAGMAAHALYFRLGNRLREAKIVRRIRELVRT